MEMKYILFFVLILSIEQVSADFSDNFNDGDISDWTIQNTWSVPSTSPFNSSSLNYAYSYTGSSAIISHNYTAFSPANFSFSFNYYPDTAYETDFYIYFEKNATTSYYMKPIHGIGTSTYTIQQNAFDGYSSPTLNSNQWYQLNMWLNNQIMKIQIKDNANNIINEQFSTLLHPMTDSSQIMFYNFLTAESAHISIDNVSISVNYSAPTPTPTPTPPSNLSSDAKIVTKDDINSGFWDFLFIALGLYIITFIVTFGDKR